MKHERFNVNKYIGSEAHINNLSIARKAQTIKVECEYCHKQYGKGQIKNHIKGCYLNPVNTKLCIVCEDPIKNFKTSTTCGYACSNKHFRSGPNNGSWSDATGYRTTCFHFHKKECVVCQESNIVSVHHLDENHNNNDPANLIPLCPTHHQYWHSRFRHLVEKQILDYIEDWKKNGLRARRRPESTAPQTRSLSFPNSTEIT